MSFRLIITAVLIAVSFHSSGQDYFERFSKLHKANDTAAARQLLTEWETAKPEDPQLYVANLNYYMRRGSQEFVSLVSGDATGKEYPVTDAKNKEVGFIDATTQYNLPLVEKGLKYIDKGIAKYPNRLDMRFGKIYVLGKIKDYKRYTAEILKSIEYGHKINNKWLWLEGKPKDDAEKFFMESVQGYVNTLYDANDDALLTYVQQISEGILKYKPNHVESLSNVGVVYMIGGKLEKGLPYLLKAESVVPKDVVVLNNIAECYKRMKKKEKAKEYYGKMIQYGNEQEKAFAEKSMREL